MTNQRILGIVGIGPRGGYALENLIIALNKKNSLSNIHFLLFEETGNFGNGQVYDTSQSQTNWINITERILRLNGRKEIDLGDHTIPPFPSYHEWVDKNFDELPKTTADNYPPRSALGKYLKERFQTLVAPLLEMGIAELLQERIEDVSVGKHKKITLKSDSNTYNDIDDVLFTIGHQPIQPSEQIVGWRKFTEDKEAINFFDSPYPISTYINNKHFSTKSSIGIRGFGLAMIDVVRGIAENFGQFITTDEQTLSCEYQTEHDIQHMLIPFSLDGLPPAPKPLNAQIDDWFKPTDEQISLFEKKISDIPTQREALSPHFLIRAFVEIAADIYINLPHTYSKKDTSRQQIGETIYQWMQDHNYEHPAIVTVRQAAKKTMREFIGMATGKEAISLDFCIGQVWRHCQPSIYERLSFNQCSESVFAAIIALDEGTKRYSYGPPVDSIQQLVALEEAGVMSLEMVNNPDFELTDDGWRFSIGDKSMTADMMIDSVLDSPIIEAVSSPIVKNMLSDDLIEAVHDNLGVHTDENGYVISTSLDKKIPIALLGRLAKGTIIGVDAILECFGSRSEKWALESSNRHIDWLKKKNNGKSI